jgi:hypothetical protein
MTVRRQIQHYQQQVNPNSSALKTLKHDAAVPNPAVPAEGKLWSSKSLNPKKKNLNPKA